MKDLEYWKNKGYTTIIEPAENGFVYKVDNQYRNIYIGFAEDVELAKSRILDFLENWNEDNI